MLRYFTISLCFRKDAQPVRASMLAGVVRLGVLCAGLVVLCAGCADLSAVAKFATSAKAASTGFLDIGNDFAASARRREAYASETEKPKIEQSAKVYEAQQPEMLAAQKVLADYVSALGAIATDSATSREASLTATTGGLEKIGLSSSQASAGVGLAKKATAALLAGYRSRKAGKVIHDCNPELQEYLKGLEQIVGTDYPLVLKNERLSVQGYYDRLLHDDEAKEPLAAVLIRKQQQADLDAITKREAAGAAYLKILTDIGQGHQKLYDAGENMSKLQLLSIVEPYIEDIANQSVTVAKAF
jgi:hypothetical protein